jgi:hypothetical protein
VKSRIETDWMLSFKSDSRMRGFCPPPLGRMAVGNQFHQIHYWMSFSLIRQPKKIGIITKIKNKKMDTKNLKIEKTFVNVKFSEREVTEFKSQVSSAEVDIIRLKKYFDIKDFNDLKKFANSEYIKAFLEQGETEYLGKTFVPVQEKKRIHESYMDVYNATATAADTIKNFFEVYPFDYTFSPDTDILNVDCNQVRKFYENRNKVTLSDDDVEYFNMICDVMRSLQSCSDWEKSHDYYNFTEQGDAFNPLENIFTMWRRGHFDGATYQAMIGGRLGKLHNHKDVDD